MKLEILVSWKVQAVSTFLVIYNTNGYRYPKPDDYRIMSILTNKVLITQYNDLQLSAFIKIITGKWNLRNKTT